LGSLYEEKKEVDKAQECFDKALSLNPESAEIQASVGRIHFNKGVALRAAANDIQDQKKYADALKISNDKFKEALPFFEKAYQLKPDEKDYLIALKGIYYNLGMGKEYDDAEEKLNKLNQ
jgi:tetratricopeptide (TPR) repeat protein